MKREETSTETGDDDEGKKDQSGKRDQRGKRDSSGFYFKGIKGVFI